MAALDEPLTAAALQAACEGKTHSLKGLDVAAVTADLAKLSPAEAAAAITARDVRRRAEAALMGGLMAIAVCFLFLRRLAVTVIIGLSVPISVIAAFASGPKDMFAKRLSSFGDQATSAGIKSCKASLVSGP